MISEAEAEIKEIRSEFSVKQVLDTEFRFCGKEVKQNDDMSIFVTAKDNNEKIRPIDINQRRKLTDAWSYAVVCTASDSSFCNESMTVRGLKEDGRSQQGHVICLAPGGIVNMTEAMIHPISWSSTTIERVC